MIKNLSLVTILVFFFATSVAADIHYADNCTLTAVSRAITDADAGDVVVVPDGNCTWGDSGAYVNINKPITLTGASRTGTIISMSSTGGSYPNAVIRLTAAATVKTMHIVSPTSGQHGTFVSIGADNARVTDITYESRTVNASSAYFVYYSKYGLVDNCSISAVNGQSEWIFGRGPTDSWQTPSTMGGANNMFVENCTFSGSGYLDANDNSRIVFRYNTINGANKFDAHGRASNSLRGARHYEVYNNLWTLDGYYAAIELRGGTGRVFNNLAANTNSGKMWFKLTDYCYTGGDLASGCGNVCRCAADYPWTDQIGVGMDPKAAASEPLYLWNNRRLNGPWSPGLSAISSTCQAACGWESQASVIQEGVDYFNSDSKPAALSSYTPYTCPHPLTGLTGSCDPSVAGTAGYNVQMLSTSTASGSYNLR